MKVDPGATIAVVGASARAAAFSLLRAGYRVVAADLFADADLAKHCQTTRVTPYPTGFAHWLAQTPCDHWLYTGALENYPELVDQLATLRPLRGHNGNTLRRVRDPLELQSVLRSQGFYFPETQVANANPTPDDDWLGKTYRGSCGSGVGPSGNATYLQRHVTGTPLAAIFSGEKLLGVTRQLVGETWTGASDYKYCGSIGPWPLPSEQLQRLNRLGKVLHQNFNLTDIYGVDFIFDGQEIWTLEVNPRYTASVEILERALGISVFDPSEDRLGEEHSQALCLPSPSPSLRGRGILSYHGKVVLYAQQPLLITPVISNQLLEEAGDTTTPTLADIPTPGTEIEPGQPILTLFAQADSCAAVEQQLRARAQLLQHKLYGAATLCD